MSAYQAVLAFDLTAAELAARYRSSTALRFTTGLLFGIAAGVNLWQAFHGAFWPLGVFLEWLALMQFVTAALFDRAGHLEAYIGRYSSAVYVSAAEEEGVQLEDHHFAPVQRSGS